MIDGVPEPKPFLISADRAAVIILRRIAGRPAQDCAALAICRSGLGGKALCQGRYSGRS